jgi:hypothetical protein
METAKMTEIQKGLLSARKMGRSMVGGSARALGRMWDDGMVTVLAGRMDGKWGEK